MAEASLVWLRNELRLTDNPALKAAIARGGPVHVIQIESEAPGARRRGGASRWWLNRSLNDFAGNLAKLGLRLETLSGDPAQLLLREAERLQAGAIYFNRNYAAVERGTEAAVQAAGEAAGLVVEGLMGDVLVEPFDISTGGGKPYAVYTPFWKTLRQMDIPRPLPRPRGNGQGVAAEPVDTDYRPPRWSNKLAQYWEIGEAAAHRKLKHFLEAIVADYREQRDIPAIDGTSRLSPHLAFGEISPRQIWHTASAYAQEHPSKTAAIDKFLSELAWREFNYNQLYHREPIAEVPMVPRFADVPWREDDKGFDAWTRGATGLPIVDAGMRELWETGYMHNRVRMLTASLLSKNLLVDWRRGEKWFWDTLLDADAANNPGNWQWVAGTGLDAAPYFRIFNPVTQGGRFDAAGDYVRRWVPELAGLPDAHVHDPASAPQAVLDKAGIRLGRDYPEPIVDLKTSRTRALEAFGAT